MSQRWVNHDGDESRFRLGPIGIEPAYGGFDRWFVGALIDREEQRVSFGFLCFGFTVQRLWRDE